MSPKNIFSLYLKSNKDNQESIYSLDELKLKKYSELENKKYRGKNFGIKNKKKLHWSITSTATFIVSTCAKEREKNTTTHQLL